MSSQPNLTGRLSHREGVWIRSQALSSGSSTDIWADRVQSITPTATHNTTDSYELGRVGKVGNVTDPTEYRIVLEENLHNSEIDMTLAGVNPTTGSGFWASNIPNQTNRAYIVRRNETGEGSVDEEVAFGGLRVAEIMYRFQVNGANTVQYTLEGTSGSYYTQQGALPHPLWGAFDTTTPGVIHGKDARIAFTANAPANKAYRLQSFTIRVQYPVQTVRELGTRGLIGKLVDTPNITVDFDLLPADFQPHDVFFPVSNDDAGRPSRVLGEPQKATAFINVYDPDLTETASVVKSFQIYNLRPSSNTPLDARVRQLTTARWSLTNVQDDPTNTGGMRVSKTELT